MNIQEKPGLKVATEGFVAVVTMARPPHNSISQEMARDLADTLQALDLDETIRCVVLAAEGRSFCAGADLSSAFENIEESIASTKRFYAEVVRLHQSRKPIVAAVQGAAIGAGVGMALLADFRVASLGARFAVNFVKIGFHPGFGLTHTLPLLVGRQNARRMFLTGQRLKAEEALAMGLVDSVVPPEQLIDTAMQLARDISENAPLAVQSTRATLRGELAAAVRRQIAHEYAEQAELMKTDDFLEGVAAVRERRAGNFTGR